MLNSLVPLHTTAPVVHPGSADGAFSMPCTIVSWYLRRPSASQRVAFATYSRQVSGWSVTMKPRIVSRLPIMLGRPRGPGSLSGSL